MRLADMVASQAPPGSLPLQPTSLIGRDQELVELAAALNKTRLLTLTGVGGVGKTRLALASPKILAGPTCAQQRRRVGPERSLPGLGRGRNDGRQIRATGVIGNAQGCSSRRPRGGGV